ncbi:unnamed protein product [Lymnaea stagnalis]|uniref:Uncharacterized protein n=1 Tax=Lymnaea stagnalis TaxID=6523 RepID=A0AAV2IMT3_LYMST
MMASSMPRHQRSSPANAKPLNSKLVNKSRPANENLTGNSFKRDTVSEMSPEAKKAMILTKQETKQNYTLPKTVPTSSLTKANSFARLKQTADSNNNNSSSSNTKVGKEPPTGTVADRAKGKTLPPKKLDSNRIRKVTAHSLGTTAAVTARSRSTLSQTFSASDHDGSFDGNNNNNDKTLGTVALTTSTLCPKDSLVSVVIVDGEDNVASDQNDSETSRVEISEDGRGSAKDGVSFVTPKDGVAFVTPKSFVLALNRALEENCISRLRGDITDTVGISETGKVRALDGGRLANAQEVVVNLRHEDDKEIVFEDDDEESLDTAKTVSKIRVSIWMEYNEGFPQDNESYGELSYPALYDPEDDITATGDDTRRQSLKVPKTSAPTSRRGEGKGNVNKNLLSPRSSSRSTGNDKNNNNSSRYGSSQSLSGTNSLRGNVSSRVGSGVTDQSKISGESVHRKRESASSRK